MHEGCSGSFAENIEVVEKVRMMGFSNHYLPMPLHIACKQCGEKIFFERYETPCPSCGAIHAVTPCHGHDASAIVCIAP
ncbi:hypothetical protein [Chitinivibrio alkaliphilus]|uniref:Uncharacterized protein n=1 Tax=Chitinivibrio alkaliphilus ACht1 TaxID=1313304 RepID=U7D9E1_9BACT|nr:hypothetical protein [Chitinivibrio alkaliphilus]ERP39009.1 hypothetical protein CALK_0501 [Chitinivibrio alkaliphilus ACht1]